MDSWAENEWLKSFGRLVDEGRTAFIITHRFTTAMHADIIHVMDDGEIVESGTHEGLLDQDGHYAESWRAQVKHGWRASDDFESENDPIAPSLAPDNPLQS
jgi:ATP-binding cassette subfamily B protein